jgi:hypothetical protein
MADSASSAGMATCGGADAAVADDQDVLAALDGIHGLGAQRGQLGLHTFMAPGQRVGDVERDAAELAVGVRLDVAQLGHVGKVQHGCAHFQPHRRVDLVDVQQVGLGADEGHQRHHDGLADRVDRRVGHLGEQLLEVVVQRLVLADSTASGLSLPMEPMASSPACAMGAIRNLMSSWVVAEGLLAVQQGTWLSEALAAASPAPRGRRA